MSKVIDLDVLRPEPVVVKLDGKEIDLSFIPCGITFEVDAITRELFGLDQEELLKNGETTRKAFDLTVKLCATFCSVKHPELDEEYFRTEVSVGQLNAMAVEIKDALVRSYSGVEEYSKNSAGASQTTTSSD